MLELCRVMTDDNYDEKVASYKAFSNGSNRINRFKRFKRITLVLNNSRFIFKET